ncbi:MAG: glucose-1-phosphate thymidylyltransferase [Balneolaceae bacterium]|nr:MAG: glucose-1-phosphate thymidylyltransferase [Balneolaceae bacterium]
MKQEFCFFEDHYLESFHPLTLTRPLHDLRVGILTLGQKWENSLKLESGTVHSILRGHLKGVFKEPEFENETHPVIRINPRFIPTPDLAERVMKLSPGQGLLFEDQLIACKISQELHKKWILTGIEPGEIDQIQIKNSEFTLLKNSWELFRHNGRQIEADIKLMKPDPVTEPARFPHALLVRPENIYIEEGAMIEPGALLYAENGPIYIGKGAQIMANSVVRGPSAVCEHSVVKMGAKIYEETTIGPVCKVGGEIANVIFHSYSNKSHDGYTGNSVFGQWCNLGADTNTSNLKNNYGTVKVYDWKRKKMYDSGQQFAGTVMGDHSKTGINSMLNTGTVCGVCCNLFSDAYPPKFIPSFSWVSGSDTVPYHFEKAMEAMERMMGRRNVPLTPSYKRMMKAIYRSTNF